MLNELDHVSHQVFKVPDVSGLSFTLPMTLEVGRRTTSELKIMFGGENGENAEGSRHKGRRRGRQRMSLGGMEYRSGKSVVGNAPGGRLRTHQIHVLLAFEPIGGTRYGFHALHTHGRYIPTLGIGLRDVSAETR